MSESETSTDVNAEIETMKVKIANLEARITHLEGGFEYHKDAETDDAA